MKKVVVFISIILSACGGASTEATTDSAAVYFDTSSSQTNTVINESIEVRHKYSYVKLNEDASQACLNERMSRNKTSNDRRLLRRVWVSSIRKQTVRAKRVLAVLDLNKNAVLDLKRRQTWF